MTTFWVELSGENLPLARAEAAGAAGALGGQLALDSLPDPFLGVELPDRKAAGALAGRLALARRVLEPWAETGVDSLSGRLHVEGRAGKSGSIRTLGKTSFAAPPAAIHRLAQSYVDAGGRIDLDGPQRQFLVIAFDAKGVRLAEEVGEVPRRSLAARRMPRLPFQRPVSLSPGLGRVAVNLAQVRPGDRVGDPFLGTGALLLEAGLLGARLVGVDRDPTMVRGALQNLAAFSLTLESATVEDVESAGLRQPPHSLDAIVSDPPYGRASPSGGEAPGDLVARAMHVWAPAVRPGGRIALVTPESTPAWDDEWVRSFEIPNRVHRSLTRRFAVFERRPEVTSPGSSGSGSRPPAPDTARKP